MPSLYEQEDELRHKQSTLTMNMADVVMTIANIRQTLETERTNLVNVTEELKILREKVTQENTAPYNEGYLAGFTACSRQIKELLERPI